MQHAKFKAQATYYCFAPDYFFFLLVPPTQPPFVSLRLLRSLLLSVDLVIVHTSLVVSAQWTQA